MSVKAVNHVLKHAPYKGATFTVLFVLAHRANEKNNHELWMKVKTIAKLARITEKATRNALSVLADDGWLEVLKPSTKGVTGVYRFAFVGAENDTTVSGNGTTVQKNGTGVSRERYSVPEERYSVPNIDSKDSKGIHSNDTKPHSSKGVSHSSSKGDSYLASWNCPLDEMPLYLLAEYIMAKAVENKYQEYGFRPSWNEGQVTQIVVQFLKDEMPPGYILEGLVEAKAYTTQGINVAIHSNVNLVPPDWRDLWGEYISPDDRGAVETLEELLERIAEGDVPEQLETKW